MPMSWKRRPAGSRIRRAADKGGGSGKHGSEGHSHTSGSVRKYIAFSSEGFSLQQNASFTRGWRSAKSLIISASKPAKPNISRLEPTSEMRKLARSFASGAGLNWLMQKKKFHEARGETEYVKEIDDFLRLFGKNKA